ncbi:MAG: CBS domain-containing protein [Nitrospira sp.]|nr:CBS domain-containing protein [Nitrospira sp.]
MCSTMAVQGALHSRDAEQGTTEHTSKATRGKGRTASGTGQVADHMASDVSVVSPETLLSEALHLITAMHLKALAVYEGKRYVGFLAASKLVSVREALGDRFQDVRVREFMNTTMSPCSPWNLLSDVRRRMRLAGQAYLLVIDKDGKVAGVLSSVTEEEQVLTFWESKDVQRTRLARVEQDPSTGSAVPQGSIR